MNKFKEFDHIKTPQTWKDDFLNQSLHQETSHFSYRFAMVCVVVVLCVSSLGLVYAYNEEFRFWISQQFPGSTIIKAPEINTGQKWRMEDKFMYYYKEISETQEKITDVYYFEKGEFLKQDIKNMEGKYNGYNYKFNYVLCGKDILTFDCEGYIEYTLPVLKDNLLYFGSADMNFCSLDMKTKVIKKITNDNKSCNFSISPNQTYVLINKSDEYWTIYNTNTQKEIRFDDLYGYAHNNEFIFMDDSHLLYYSSDESTSILDLKTMKIKEYDKFGWYPVISTLYFDFEDNETIVENFMTNQKRTLPYIDKDYNWSVLENRYILLESEDSNKIIFYDFEMDEEKILDYPIHSEEEYLEYIIIDEEYMIITNSKEYYIIEI